MRPASKKRIVIAMVAAIMLIGGTSARFDKKDDGITHRNLRVLPSTIPKEKLIAAMREINTALGVKCGYCHKESGATTAEGRPELDFASDDKITKRVARKMMVMTENINNKLDDLGDGKFERVSCATCHRGHTQPSFTLDTATHSVLKDILR